VAPSIRLSMKSDDFAVSQEKYCAGLRKADPGFTLRGCCKTGLVPVAKQLLEV
jgi:hypothetical protein